MKRVISVLTVLVLCFALAVPAFATSTANFVPSITAKPAPDVVIQDTTVTLDGTETEAEGTVSAPVIEVKNESNEVVYAAPVVDLVVTAVSEVQAEDAAETVVITKEAVENLKTAYEQLSKEEFKLSEEAAPEVIEQVKELLVAQVVEQLTVQLEEQGVAAEAIETAVAAATDTTSATVAEIVDSAVVTALFDVSVTTEELETYLAEDGNTVDLTFKADVPENHHVFVMVYKNDQWQMIENVVINGDGTITCTFAHFCPVAILTAPIVEVEVEVEAPAEEATEAAAEAATEAATEAPAETPAASAETEAEGGFAWWWIVLIAAVVVIIAVVKGKGKKTEAKK